MFSRAAASSGRPGERTTSSRIEGATQWLDRAVASELDRETRRATYDATPSDRLPLALRCLCSMLPPSVADAVQIKTTAPIYRRSPTRPSAPCPVREWL